MNNMINNNINSIERMAEVISKRKKQDVNASYDGPSFTEILSRQKSIDEIVSDRTDVKKAVTGQIRLTQRDIRLTDDQMTRLEEGTKKASDKGIKESLVLVDDLAFIVNTDKKMVITAIDQNSSEDNIYTNIDGAVII
jgi:flagellar operon protein